MSHKWTKILFVLLNFKLGICICGLTIIDINSQSNFYDVITLYHTSICTGFCLLWSPENLKTTQLENNLQLVPSGYGPFMQVLGHFLFLLIFRRKEFIITKTHAQHFQIYNISVPKLPSNISSLEDNILVSIEKLCDLVVKIEISEFKFACVV